MGSYKECINKCQFLAFKDLSTTFEGSLNVSYNIILLIIGDNACTNITFIHTVYSKISEEENFWFPIW